MFYCRVTDWDKVYQKRWCDSTVVIGRVSNMIDIPPSSSVPGLATAAIMHVSGSNGQASMSNTRTWQCSFDMMSVSYVDSGGHQLSPVSNTPKHPHVSGKSYHPCPILAFEPTILTIHNLDGRSFQSLRMWSQLTLNEIEGQRTMPSSHVRRSRVRNEAGTIPSEHTTCLNLHDCVIVVETNILTLPFHSKAK